MLIYDTCQDLFLLRSNPITRSNSKLPFAFVESLPHCWRICFCIMRSMCGCGASIRICHSNGTPTMESCIAGQKRRRWRCEQRSPREWRNAGWSFIRRRRKWSIARMRTGGGDTRTRNFDFLGYVFQPRRSKNRFGKYFINFSPAVSDTAGKSIREEIRSWKLHLRSGQELEALSRMFNPKIRGWLQYYGRYYRSALYPYMQLDRSLARWANRKYKKLRGHI